VSARAELEAFNGRFAAALAGQDLEGVLGFYTEDARLLFHGLPMIEGGAALEAFWREELRRPGSIRFESVEIFEAASLVVDVGRYRSAQGAGKYVVVYRRQPDGSLKIAVDTATADAPPQS
jgi:ketosteroid isomerase-like protein